MDSSERKNTYNVQFGEEKRAGKLNITVKACTGREAVINH